jgi:hypothetical protein
MLLGVWVCDIGGGGGWVLRTGGIWLKTRDLCRCLSIGEEREIAWCDCNELGGVNLKVGSRSEESEFMVLVPVWYTANAGWLAFLVSKIERPIGWRACGRK